jgi:hypothetical protein
MRKSSMFSMAIILVALVAMMIAADMALKPMKRTLAIGADLTATKKKAAPKKKVAKKKAAKKKAAKKKARRKR